MTEAVKRMLDFAFGDLALRRIGVQAVVENEASNALIQKLGFRYEGRARAKTRAQATGLWHDTFEYGMLREDWEK